MQYGYRYALLAQALRKCMTALEQLDPTSLKSGELAATVRRVAEGLRAIADDVDGTLDPGIVTLLRTGSDEAFRLTDSLRADEVARAVLSGGWTRHGGLE